MCDTAGEQKIGWSDPELSSMILTRSVYTPVTSRDAQNTGVKSIGH